MSENTTQAQAIDSHAVSGVIIEDTLESANSALTGRINGKFAPGFSGNPNGRPKSRAISERLRLRLEEGKADELADNLVEMAEDKGDKWLALAASKEIIDRTEGKAMQRAMVGVSIDPRTLEHIANLAEKLLGV